MSWKANEYNNLGTLDILAMSSTLGLTFAFNCWELVGSQVSSLQRGGNGHSIYESMSLVLFPLSLQWLLGDLLSEYQLLTPFLTLVPPHPPPPSSGSHCAIGHHSHLNGCPLLKHASGPGNMESTGCPNLGRPVLVQTAHTHGHLGTSLKAHAAHTKTRK